MGFCGGKLVLINRNAFIAVPFIAAGFGGDELVKGIRGSDALRILGSVCLIIQGLFAAFIFIRNSIAGQNWKCRGIIFFTVGAITGLIVGLTVYYPIAAKFENDQDVAVVGDGTDVKIITVNEDPPSNAQTSFDTVVKEPEAEVEIISKLRFLIPELLLSILLLVNTVYGVSIKLPHERPTVRSEEGNEGSKEEEMEQLSQDQRISAE